MTTLDGEAPAPTFRSILAGIAAAILVFMAFFNLPILFKSVGAVLGFVPDKLGLIHTVHADEVIEVDLSVSPSSIAIPKPGDYVLYTGNYDLLVINDAVVEAQSDGWLTMKSENGDSIPVRFISRAMAWYDTIYAKGRPVATFSIEAPGTYTITHPTRHDAASIVPNYVSGRENLITFIYLVEVAILVFIVWDIRGAIRERRRRARE